MNLLLNKECYFYENSSDSLSFIHFNTTLKKISAENYYELALTYKEKGLTRKVIFFYKKALDLRILSFGLLNTKTISAFKRLAEAYSDAGMRAESLIFYKKSLELNQNLFGKNSLEVASSYSALANIHFREENLEEAFGFYVQALKIRETHLGEKHPLTASSQYELGYFYAASEEYNLALPLFEKALETRVELYRFSHPETAKSYNSLAMCHYHLFHYEKAHEYLIETIKIKEMIYSKNDERTLLCKMNLKEIQKNFLKEKKDTFIRSVARWIKSF